MFEDGFDALIETGPEREGTVARGFEAVGP
jgi:hypothetical protein